MTPSHYTTTEGGKWIPWTAGSIDFTTVIIDIRRKHPESGARIWLNGCLVHALKFSDCAREWDVINGWRPKS